MVLGASTTTTAAIGDDPLFKTADGALKFAFLYSSQQYPLTIMAKMMRGYLGSGKGLSGVDGAAQAGMILGIVARLSPEARAALSARYTLPEDKRFMEAINLLTMSSMQAVSGLSHRLMRQALIAKRYGVRVCVAEIAERCGVHRNTASNHGRALKDYLQALEDRAYTLVSDEMRERGLLE